MGRRQAVGNGNAGKTAGGPFVRAVLVLCSAATCTLTVLYAFLVVVMGHADIAADWRGVLSIAAPMAVAVAGFAVAARPRLWPIGVAVGAMALLAALALGAAPDAVGVSCGSVRPLVLVFDALAAAMPTTLLTASAAARPDRSV